MNTKTKEDFLKMRPAIFIYRCRKCGVETTESLSVKSFWDHPLHKAAEKMAAGEVPMHCVHIHDGAGAFISDLVGARDILPEEVQHWML